MDRNPTRDGDGDPETSEWKFDLEDIDADDGRSRYIETGTPSPENAFFVILGMIFALFVLARGVGLI